MVVTFRDSISRFIPYIYDIRRVCGGMPVKSGVSFLIFQGWDICANRIIPLGMSLIGDTRKGNFSWSMDFNLSWWKKIVANQKIFKWFVLADMEVYLGRRVSKKWLICLLLSSFLISHSSVKSKYGGETEN